MKLIDGKIAELELKLKKDLEPYTAFAPYVSYLIEIDISKSFYICISTNYWDTNF